MAILFTDAFNRADSTTTPGTPDAGGPYTVRTGTWGINGNRLYTPVSTAASLLTFPAAIDIDISAKFAVINGFNGLVFRYVDTANYWMAMNSGSTWTLTHRTAGVNTVMLTGPSFTAGDTVRVVALGNMIYLLVNGKSSGQIEDGWRSAATPVAGFHINSSTTARIDDASAADATAVPGISTSTASVLTDQRIPATPYTGAFVYKGRDAASLDTLEVA